MNSKKIDLTGEIKDKYNLISNYQIMESGETRFRLLSKNNYGYIMTETKNSSGFQESHYHKTTNEMYIVQQGKVKIYYKDKNEEIKELILNENDTFLVRPFISHNIYMYDNTIIHTVKFGKCEDNDWYPDTQMDKLLKK